MLVVLVSLVYPDQLTRWLGFQGISRPSSPYESMLYYRTRRPISEISSTQYSEFHRETHAKIILSLSESKYSSILNPLSHHSSYALRNLELTLAYLLQGIANLLEQQDLSFNSLRQRLVNLVKNLSGGKEFSQVFIEEMLWFNEVFQKFPFIHHRIAFYLEQLGKRFQHAERYSVIPKIEPLSEDILSQLISKFNANQITNFRNYSADHEVRIRPLYSDICLIFHTELPLEISLHSFGMATLNVNYFTTLKHVRHALLGKGSDTNDHFKTLLDRIQFRLSLHISDRIFTESKCFSVKDSELAKNLINLSELLGLHRKGLATMDSVSVAYKKVKEVFANRNFVPPRAMTDIQRYIIDNRAEFEEDQFYETSAELSPKVIASPQLESGSMRLFFTAIAYLVLAIIAGLLVFR
jgi:hypothetical protein